VEAQGRKTIYRKKFTPPPAKLYPAFIEKESCNLSEPSSIQLLDLIDDFWVLTINNAVFVQSENQFRQYNPASGIYSPVLVLLC
jgi:hypothetical protein